MSDLVERLRRLYAQHGTDYVQEAADEIERLRGALKVIHTWASVDGALNPTHVRELAHYALYPSLRSSALHGIPQEGEPL